MENIPQQCIFYMRPIKSKPVLSTSDFTAEHENCFCIGSIGKKLTFPLYADFR
jgi:hypothetical protein